MQTILVSALICCLIAIAYLYFQGRKAKKELNDLRELRVRLAGSSEKYAGARILSADQVRGLMRHYSIEQDMIIIEGIGGADIKWLTDGDALKNEILPPHGQGYRLMRENTYYFRASDKKHFLGAAASVLVPLP